MSHPLISIRQRVSSNRRARRTARWSTFSLERLEARRLLSGNVRMQFAGPPFRLSSYAGVGFQENDVAFLQAQINDRPDTNKGDFQVTIQWGDGGSSSGDLVYEGSDSSWAEYLI